VRILAEDAGAELVGIFDTDREIADRVGAEFGADVFATMGELADGIEAAVVAVPTVDHCAVGCELLQRGIDVLVEKPIASTLEEADRLVRAAEQRVLAVGHVEFFNPAVQRLMQVEGQPGFVEIHRLAVFTPRSLDIDVVLDLMIHDLQILHALDESPVSEVRATGISVLSSRIDIANARVALESGCVANLTASRVSSQKVRKLRVFLPDQGYYSVDYQKQEVQGFRLRVEGEVRNIVPDPLPVDKDEPLKKELQAFLAQCRGEDAVLVDGDQGRRALRTAYEVLEAISA
jgi:predicted dehydrogenase